MRVRETCGIAVGGGHLKYHAVPGCDQGFACHKRCRGLAVQSLHVARVAQKLLNRAKHKTRIEPQPGHLVGILKEREPCMCQKSRKRLR